ncbi:MAG: 50S ribosomal protein L15 [Pseudomonadota bacterium]
MKLNELSDNEGATRPRKRVGRGIGSGLGKQGGRGNKGQKSRSGVAIKGFEGGQMPIHRRLPKRGFNVPFPTRYNAVNLDRLQAAVDAGKLKDGSVVDTDTLIAAGVIRRAKDGTRLLGRGELKAKLTLKVAGASKSAVAAVEKAGGTVEIVTAEPAPKEKAEADEKNTG